MTGSRSARRSASSSTIARPRCSSSSTCGSRLPAGTARGTSPSRTSRLSRSRRGCPVRGSSRRSITSKSADHLPLYRQEGIFARHGVELSRKTMCGWMAQSAWLLEPIWKAMRAEVLKSRVIQTDDTTVPVLDRRLGSGPHGPALGLRRRSRPSLCPSMTTRPTAAATGRSGSWATTAATSRPTPTAATTGSTPGAWSRSGAWPTHAASSSTPAPATPSGPTRRWRGFAPLYAVEVAGKGLDDAGAARPAPRAVRPDAGAARDLAGRAGPGRAAEEPDRRGDRLRPLELDGVEPLCRGRVPGDRQQRQRAGREAGRPRPEELAVRRERGRRADRGDPVQPRDDLQGPEIDPFAYLRDVLDRVCTHPARRIAELLPDRWRALRSGQGSTP